jgi:putative ABC transport system substrate-binding protein
MLDLRWREFIALIAGGGPLLAVELRRARGQQPAQVRRIGVLMPFAEDHPVGQARVAASVKGLQQSGWTDGRNVRIDYRWSAGDADRIRKLAMELIALGPDVVMAFTSAAVAPLRQVTSTVPIVFAVVADPVGRLCRELGAAGR